MAFSLELLPRFTISLQHLRLVAVYSLDIIAAVAPLLINSAMFGQVGCYFLLILQIWRLAQSLAISGTGFSRQRAVLCHATAGRCSLNKSFLRLMTFKRSAAKFLY